MAAIEHGSGLEMRIRFPVQGKGVHHNDICVQNLSISLDQTLHSGGFEMISGAEGRRRVDDS